MPRKQGLDWARGFPEHFLSVLNPQAVGGLCRQLGIRPRGKQATNSRNQAANELYDGLLTIQNAADLQWPESNGENVSIRNEFRLGIFPPHFENGKNGKNGKKTATNPVGETSPAAPTPPA